MIRQRKPITKRVMRLIFALSLALASSACGAVEPLIGETPRTVSELHDHLTMSINRMTLERKDSVTVEFTPTEGENYVLVLIPSERAGRHEMAHVTDRLRQLGYGERLAVVKPPEGESRAGIVLVRHDGADAVWTDGVEFSKPMFVAKRAREIAYLTATRRRLTETEIRQTPSPAGVLVTEVR